MSWGELHNLLHGPVWRISRFGSQGLKILLVNIEEPREKVAHTVASRGYRSQVLLDTTGQAANVYRVLGTPTSYLVSRDGLVLGGAVGPRACTQSPARSLLLTLLGAGTERAR